MLPSEMLANGAVIGAQGGGSHGGQGCRCGSQAWLKVESDGGANGLDWTWAQTEEGGFGQSVLEKSGPFLEK